jgi:tripartite-type tricarboxylate transporter receptor subunit TctC
MRVMRTAILAMVVTVPLVGCNSGGSDESDADYPSDDITQIVYTDPGSSVDNGARVLGPLLQKDLDVSVVTENKSGGGGVIGFDYLMDQDADGYSIGHWTPTFSSLAAQGLVDPDKVDFICDLFSDYSTITVPEDSPFDTLDELVDYAKDNPGELRASGGAGANSFNHQYGQKFADVADFEWTWVPFDASPDVVLALTAGNLDVGIVPIDSVEGGKTLAILSPERSQYLPDVPTTTELGYDIGDPVAWHGILVPKGVSDERKQTLIDAVQKVMDSPEWTDFVTEQNAEPGIGCGDDFRDVVESEIEATKAFNESLG